MWPTCSSHSNRYKLTAIFGPQHGFRSDLQDNMIETPHAKDRRRNVPVYSLYSETREPTDGDARPASTCWSSTCRTSARASTPSSTRWPTACAPRRGTACRSSCATARIRSAASQVEGPMLEPGYRVVRRPVPHPDAPRHDDRRAGAALQRAFRHRRRARGRADGGLVARRCTGDATGLPWVMPSPNMPTLDTAIVYPGTVLFEGTHAVRGPRHDAAVRADRRAVARRRARSPSA